MKNRKRGSKQTLSCHLIYHATKTKSFFFPLCQFQKTRLLFLLHGALSSQFNLQMGCLCWDGITEQAGFFCLDRQQQDARSHIGGVKTPPPAGRKIASRKRKKQGFLTFKENDDGRLSDLDAGRTSRYTDRGTYTLIKERRRWQVAAEQNRIIGPLLLCAFIKSRTSSEMCHWAGRK